jgi:uncharacterized protein YnzC (UPF0291/DUF896 family)
MGDPAASPRQRVKAAAVAARYTHARAGVPGAPTVIVVDDKFDFKVDPEVARAERDDRVREATLKANWYKRKSSYEKKAGDQELEQIGKRRAERLALVKFLDGYTSVDREADQKRLNELYSKRRSRKKLAPEEDAEEAHLAVRVLHPEVKKFDPGLRWSCQIYIEWPTTRIAELDERVVGGETLTAAEEAERQNLRRQYPQSAAEADTLDHRFRYARRGISACR